MATTRYVYSGAAGTNDGTSWTNAYADLATCDGNCTEGDLVLVHYQHAKDYTSDQALYFTGGNIRIVSVDKDNSNKYRFGAEEKSSSAAYLYIDTAANSQLILDGLKIGSTGSDTLYLSPSYIRERLIFRNCSIYHPTSGAAIRLGASYGNQYLFDRCVFEAASTTRTEFFTMYKPPVPAIFRNCVFQCSATCVRLFGLVNENSAGFIIIEDSDLSNFTDLYDIDGTTESSAQIICRRCRMNSTPYDLWEGTNRWMDSIILEYCSTAEVTATPIGLLNSGWFGGTIAFDTATYRATSATDGENYYSIKFDGNSNCTALNYLKTPQSLSIWHDASASKTLTIYMGSDDSALTDEEVWAEVSWNDEASTTYATGEFLSTRQEYGLGVVAKAAITFTAATDDVCTSAGHGYTDGMRVRLTTTGTLPGGLSAGTTYYIRDDETDTFKLSTSYLGTAVDITSTGSGTHTATPFLCTDSSTWAAGTVGTKYKIVIPGINPQEPGPVTINLYFAGGDQNLWVCPDVSLA